MMIRVTTLTIHTVLKMKASFSHDSITTAAAAALIVAAAAARTWASTVAATPLPTRGRSWACAARDCQESPPSAFRARLTVAQRKNSCWLTNALIHKYFLGDETNARGFRECAAAYCQLRAHRRCRVSLGNGRIVSGLPGKNGRVLLPLVFNITLSPCLGLSVRRVPSSISLSLSFSLSRSHSLACHYLLRPQLPSLSLRGSLPVSCKLDAPCRPWAARARKSCGGSWPL